LTNKIAFEKQDACNLRYASESFNYIIGIEGPAHFNTRKQFLQQAYQMLDHKGVLLLSDITVNQHEMQKNWFSRMLGRFCAKEWYMPKANWMSNAELKALISEIGFTINSFESAGDKVFPGFSHFNLKWSSIRNAFSYTGDPNCLGLTIISWVLGYVYRKKMIDYAFIRATKTN
jgi:cyclopropane fatty-acyl-phospholipid synthase-like methyltransferase